MTDKQALDLATAAHSGKFRRNSTSPYIVHPIAVSNIVSGEYEKIVAYLHDVVEDCDQYTMAMWPSRSEIEYNYTIWHEHTTPYALPRVVGQCLDLLTKKKGQSYTDYIQKIMSAKGQVKSICKNVKIADIVHNLSDSPSDHAKQKYLKAMKILLKG